MESVEANRKAKIERNIAELVRAFPLAFSADPERTKPLEIGIKQRIYARCTLSHREVGDALRRYTSRVAYLLTIIEGAVRVDLDGKANGQVTAQEAAYAAEQTKKTFAIAAREPMEKITPKLPAAENDQPPPTPGASKPGPQRLGLPGLQRAAAAQRDPPSPAGVRLTG